MNLIPDGPSLVGFRPENAFPLTGTGAADATSTATYTFDAYGRPASSTGSVTQPFGYAGEYTDPETGLQYLRARYYDPATAQFLTWDPANALTRSAYGYAANNPVNFTDPTGLEWYDPRDWDQDVVNIAKDVGGRAVDVTVATVNTPVTASTGAVNSWTGGDCDWAKSLTVVCYGGAISGFSDHTFVTGSTINTTRSKVDYATAYDGNLHRHETWHTRQWALFGGGLKFPALYGLETLRTRGDVCQNVFEIWAGLKDGGYK
jgi:RHS repeat-associated protein